MNISSLEIKSKTNYDSDTISHINDFECKFISSI